MSDSARPFAPTEPRRLWIGLARPLWIGLAVVVLVVTAVALRIGLPMYHRHIAMKEIERLGGGIVTEHVGPPWLRSWVDNRRIRSLYKITSVGLHDSRITDASLAYLNEMPELQALSLGRTPITDEGLRHLKGLTELRELDLMDTKVTDAGIVHLKGLRHLEFLALWKTRVTKSGVSEMEHAVPGLRVFW